MPVLGAALLSLTEPIVLVLDDVHQLVDGEALDALGCLVDHIPDGSAFVLAGRATPPLSLSRLRAQGRLLEIGAGELRLSEKEARATLTVADCIWPATKLTS